MRQIKVALSCACGAALVASLALGAGMANAWVDARRAVPTLAGHDVFSVLSDSGEPGTLYLVGNDLTQADQRDSSANVTEVQAGKRALPWNVRVRYSLDGPDVPRDQVAGASGMVGVHITAVPAGGDDTPHTQTRCLRIDQRHRESCGWRCFGRSRACRRFRGWTNLGILSEQQFHTHFLGDA